MIEFGKVWFIRSRNDCQIHVLQLISNVRREIQTCSSDDATGRRCTANSVLLVLEEVDIEGEHETTFCASVDKKFTRSRSFESTKEFSLENINNVSGRRKPLLDGLHKNITGAVYFFLDIFSAKETPNKIVKVGVVESLDWLWSIVSSSTVGLKEIGVTNFGIQKSSVRTSFRVSGYRRPRCDGRLICVVASQTYSIGCDFPI